MNKNRIVVANLKMNLVLKFELKTWLQNFKQVNTFSAKQRIVDLVVCPPIIHLTKFVEIIGEKRVYIGAQDCFWERKGSYTGAVSPASIYSFGGRYVILGHSERKKYFGETENIINLKLLTATKVGLKTIMCIGETIEEKKQDCTKEVLLQQLDGYLKNFSLGQLDKLLICYEPVWAISANNPVESPTTDEIMTARLIIKKYLVDKYGAQAAERVSILYGGSVDRRNVKEVCLDTGMDGVLIGKASLIPAELFGVLNAIDNN